jgi:murein DD-endopeptidase MepM/ murein hydrolase activator NlpD
LSACGSSGEGAETTPTPTALPTSVVIATPTPTSAPTPTPGDFQYVVQDGDTLQAIADQFGITLEALLEANDLTAESIINIGDVLLIVGSEAPPLSTPRPTVDPAIITDNPAGTGWLIPIEGACLPVDDEQMPNAPREYRNGIHEGVDFFTGFSCVDVPIDLPVHAAKGGEVIRADHDFSPLTQEEVDEYEQRAIDQGFTDAAALDRFRGRQLWIRHDDNTVTRYCHLNRISDVVLPGSQVERGDIVGFTGDTGLPESLTNPGFAIHLHFELRIGDSYLGEGLPPDEVRALYENSFFGE